MTAFPGAGGGAGGVVSPGAAEFWLLRRSGREFERRAGADCFASDLPSARGGSTPPCPDIPGSLFMMLTGGMEVADGKLKLGRIDIPGKVRTGAGMLAVASEAEPAATGGAAFQLAAWRAV